MSKGAHAFKQSDVVRALKAAVKAGFPTPQIEIDKKTGNIRLITDAAGVQPAEVDEWDRI